AALPAHAGRGHGRRREAVQEDRGTAGRPGGPAARARIPRSGRAARTCRTRAPGLGENQLERRAHSARANPTGALMPIKTRYILTVSMDVDADKEALFNEVYDTEHVPLLLKVPGVLAVTRLKM